MRRLFAAMCIVSALGVSLPAVADSTCLPLLNDLRQHLFNGNVSIRHSTNYSGNALSFNGWVYGCWLNRMPKDGFSGGGVGCFRQIMRERQAPTDEAMGYEISADAKLTFVIPGSTTRYGPYDMTCVSDKFAIVNTFDSIETFLFIRQP
jgi:hypothetical protein